MDDMISEINSELTNMVDNKDNKDTETNTNDSFNAENNCFILLSYTYLLYLLNQIISAQFGDNKTYSSINQ